MTAPISMDLRERAIRAYQSGNVNYETIAKQFGIGRASLNRWLRLVRETGSATPKKIGGSTPYLDDKGQIVLRKIVEQKNDATLAEIAAELHRQTGVSMVVSGIHKNLARLGITRKKKTSTRPKEKTIRSNC